MWVECAAASSTSHLREAHCAFFEVAMDGIGPISRVGRRRSIRPRLVPPVWWRSIGRHPVQTWQAGGEI
eukprot:468011-Amphidinium_carterae.3